jgi:SOS-response transcriptional repressor LexA
MPENDKYQPIKIKPENDVTIWGVVTYTIKKHI